MDTTQRIRPLKYSDRLRLTQLLEKLADKVGSNGIFNLISSEIQTGSVEEKQTKKEDVFSNIGVSLVKSALQVINEDVRLWFAELLGKSAEEFMELPFDIEMVIIQQLMEAPEANSFFTIALQVFNKMKTFGIGLPKKQTV